MRIPRLHHLILTLVLLPFVSADSDAREEGAAAADAAATTAAAAAAAAAPATVVTLDPLPPPKKKKVVPRRSAMEIARRAGKRALGGGRQGATAGVVQVVSMMWLRTTMNYQYRYGTSTGAAIRELWRQGGVPRFYKGLSFALLQGPLARFGSTAANEAMLAIAAEFGVESSLALSAANLLASLAAGGWRLVIIPIDTCKTVLQVDGQGGFATLVRRVRRGQVGLLYAGALASALATAVGHFPWFGTFNFLNDHVPESSVLATQLFRNAGIGLAASVVSDLTTNWIRVIKTTKQVSTRPDGQPLTYREVLDIVLKQDPSTGTKGHGRLPRTAAEGAAGLSRGRAVRSLLFRGLGTRVLANGAQSMVFTVCWRYLRERAENSRRAAAAAATNDDTTAASAATAEEEEGTVILEAKPEEADDEQQGVAGGEESEGGMVPVAEEAVAAEGSDEASDAAAGDEIGAETNASASGLV